MYDMKKRIVQGWEAVWVVGGYGVCEKGEGMEGTGRRGWRFVPAVIRSAVVGA